MLKCQGTGGSERDINGSMHLPGTATAGEGMSEAVDKVSSLVPIGCSGGACATVEVRLTGWGMVEPCCATEKTEGELI